MQSILGKVVFDTSVLVAAVRSRQGVSFALVRTVPSPAAGCRHIVTHNIRDFRGAERLGVTAITPGNFLNLMRSKP